MSSYNIMLDIDGVLADFMWGYTALAQELGYIPRAYGTKDQPEWSFDASLSPQQQVALWDIINKDTWWWANLRPLVSPRVMETLNILQMTNQVVFCTNRPGKQVQLQTKYWLATQGVVNPAVIVTKRKGEVAHALAIDFSLDDSVHNANCIHWMADVQPCQSYLLDQPYNRIGRIKGVRVVASVEEFLGKLGKKEENGDVY